MDNVLKTSNINCESTYNPKEDVKLKIIVQYNYKWLSPYHGALIVKIVESTRIIT